MASPRVLFLCSGNYYRSRFAEAVFNFHATRRGLAARAVSRGLAVHLVKDFPEQLSLDTEAGLVSRGIPLEHTSRYPQQCEIADLALAWRIVAMKEAEHRVMLDVLFPGWAERVEFWDIHDVEADSPAAQLPLLEARVLALLDTLAA